MSAACKLPERASVRVGRGLHWQSIKVGRWRSQKRRAEEEGEAIVRVRFSPRCHPATVVTSKFSREDGEEEKEEGRWLKEEEEEEEDRTCGRKGGRRRREVHTNKTEINTPKPNCDGHQDVFQRAEIKKKRIYNNRRLCWPGCEFGIRAHKQLKERWGERKEEGRQKKEERDRLTPAVCS